jgi:glucose-1-phosphate adenylyltransferase
LRKLLLLTQYKAMSLDRHINTGWRQYFCSELGEFIDVLPPQQRIDEQWYQGTADAVYQNIYAMEKERPQFVLILAGDHIYKMNYRAMVEYHQQMNADLTVAALHVDRESAKSFGVMEVNDQNRLIGFEEKPADPKGIPGDNENCLASMGIYVFTTRFLFEQLLTDANSPESSHDFGKNIIPSIIESDRVYAFPFRDENRKSQAYWRDVGTLDAYYEANMDLVGVDPMLNMYDQRWPIRTHQGGFPPPKFVFGSDDGVERVGMATDSLVCPGSIVSGGRVERCILGPEVRVNSYAHVSDSILFDGVEVGRHAEIRRAIVDKNVRIPEHAIIGVDHELDRARGFCVTESGIVVIGKSDSVEPGIPRSHFSAKAATENKNEG